MFAGKVARTSNALDSATRCLLTEVDIANPDRALLAGMYAQVSFDVKRQDRPIFVPATAVLFDAQGTRVAALHDGVVHWAKVDIESDLGDRLAIATGVAEGDLVAVNPSEHLLEGMRVEPQEMNLDETPRARAAPNSPEPSTSIPSAGPSPVPETTSWPTSAERMMTTPSNGAVIVAKLRRSARRTVSQLRP
jgi:hypothetical protein